MRLVAPFGFYGWGNIGDEATLQGFAQLLSKTGTEASVWVASQNPSHTARVEPAFRYFNARGNDPRRWAAKLLASAHAIVGGTPIMDVLGRWPLCELAPLARSIDRGKVPLAFVGIGTESLQYGDSRRIVAEVIAPRVRHWSVRCGRDRRRLIEYGVSPDVITVAADMAWLLEPATPDFGEYHLQRWDVDPVRPLIGVNLVNENSIFDREPRMLNALAVALDELAGQMDARVVFFANEIREGSTFDKAAALKVISQMKRADRTVLAPNDYFTPQQMMSLVSCCDLTISMRYHFCMFSALQGVPFIAIERSDKVSDLCWDMSWPARVVPPVFDASEIVEHAGRIRQDASAIEQQLSHEVRKMADRSLQNAMALNALANGRPVDIAQRIRISVAPILKKFTIKG
jgi:polysaccharide pyruvyl transferase WcaK-like protein